MIVLLLNTIQLAFCRPALPIVHHHQPKLLVFNLPPPIPALVGCVPQDVCNSNASFDLTGDQLLSAMAELERAQALVKARMHACHRSISPALCGGAVACCPHFAALPLPLRRPPPIACCCAPYTTPLPPHLLHRMMSHSPHICAFHYGHRIASRQAGVMMVCSSSMRAGAFCLVWTMATAQWGVMLICRISLARQQK